MITFITGIITIIIIWGGFIFFIIKAINFEKKKMIEDGKKNNSIN